MKEGHNRPITLGDRMIAGLPTGGGKQAANRRKARKRARHRRKERERKRQQIMKNDTPVLNLHEVLAQYLGEDFSDFPVVHDAHGDFLELPRLLVDRGGRRLLLIGETTTETEALADSNHSLEKFRDIGISQ